MPSHGVVHQSSYCEIKQNDTSPALTTTLLADGVPFDLTAAIGVLFTMTACAHPREVKINGQAATFAADTTGAVSYQWQPGDTDTIGQYIAEWTVLYPASIQTTVPSKGFDIIEVTKRAA